MTKEQQEAFMNFIAGDNHYKKYWDEFTLLLETGLRISEFAGLTKGELDFKSGKIKVDISCRGYWQTGKSRPWK